MVSSSADVITNTRTFPAVKTIVHAALTIKNPKSSPQPIQETTVYYGVFFYPYLKPGDDPIFAVVGGREVIIIRLLPLDEFETIMVFNDEELNTELLCTACWTKDKATGDPLLAVGGSGAIIKLLNIKTGKRIRNLCGHGEDIMELVTHPLDQNIIVSTGSDTTIMFWSLDPKNSKQPCALICAGEGHRETILSIAFHATGRYLLSGGMDHSVNLWVIPEFADAAAGTDKPLRIMYPHFSTNSVHTNYVDSLAFYEDFILSKSAAEDKIVLWTIQNFNSRAPPPLPDLVPTTYDDSGTRSVFGGTYERILQFQAVDTQPFYMRFGFFSHPHKSPILAMGNINGKVFLWDLSMIQKYGKWGTGDKSEGTPSEKGTHLPAVSGKLIKQDDIGDFFGLVKPHHTIDIPKVKTTIRHAAWSPDGLHMVVVGENSHITICRR